MTAHFAPPRPPVRLTAADLQAKGLAVAMADLAEALGVGDPTCLPDTPQLLTGAGLPAKPPPGAVLAAHQIYQDRQDGWRWRGNAFLRRVVEECVAARPKTVEQVRQVVAATRVEDDRRTEELRKAARSERRQRLKTATTAADLGEDFDLLPPD